MSSILHFCLHTGRLRNLQVANHSQLSVNGTCEIHLTCTAENPNDNILLKWQISGNTSLNEANITISWDPKTSNEETYTCIAQNPISNLSFSVSAQSLCKGNSLSQVSLKALSSCGLWHVPHALRDSQNSSPVGGSQRILEENRQLLELCASHYPQRSLLPPSSTPNSSSSPLRGQE